MSPDRIEFRLGAGALSGWIHLRHPSKNDRAEVPMFGWHKYPAWVIYGLYVHPLRRNKGWGSMLMEMAQEYATVQGHDLFLYVIPYGNTRAKTKRQLQHFYRAFGFVHIPSKDESWYYWASPRRRGR